MMTFLGIFWLAGSLLFFARAGLYVFRFQRLLRHAVPAPADLRLQAERLARHMGLRSCPSLWLVPGPIPPMVWAAVGPVRIFFPAGLLRRLDDEGRASLLAHELAHVGRRDHWVRWLEVAAAGLYWWYPLVWLARRQLQAREE
jgi:beta-lactamase regulating signal transducer with metallopeptidase domain